VLLFCLSSCGSEEALVRFQGSSAKITRPALDHWMKVLVAGDFLTYLHRPAPLGLASEPADPSECAGAAKKLAPRSSTGALELSDAQIDDKCRVLHQTIKTEALNFLLEVQWMTREGEERGVRVSEEEVRRQFPAYAKELYGEKANQRRYFAERHMNLADAMYQLKRSILYTRLKLKFRDEVARIGGGQRTFVRLALANYHGMIAKTICTAGYVILGCRGYREPAELPTPSWITLEGFTKSEA
jgi:hypothetical protein